MNLSGNLFESFSVLVFIIALAGPVSAQQNALDELSDKFRKGQIFYSEFTHHFIDSYTGDSTSSQGLIWVGRERYKVRTENQSLVVDGSTSMVYDDNRNRVIISDYDPAEDDFAPSRILSGIDSTFNVEQEKNSSEGIILHLVSDDPFAIYKEVKIVLSPELVPRKIEAIDPSDNVIITSFQDGEFIEFTQDMFHLEYPGEAEIIDMRN